MQVESTSLSGVLILKPDRFSDERGWFAETWNKNRLSAAGLDIEFVQDNHSFSAHAGTIRGLHYQAPPRAQAKLVRCTKGKILDVAVDVRVGSPTYGKSVAVELTPENSRQMLIPVGFLHGFITLCGSTEVQYKCSDSYSPHHEGSVLWNSAGIDWRSDFDPFLSPKDRAAPRFEDWASPFLWSRDT